MKLMSPLKARTEGTRNASQASPNVYYAHVPADLLRGIDGFLDLTDLRQHLAPFYSHTGRPSIDPELMVRMLLVGHCFGIRSERVSVANFASGSDG